MKNKALVICPTARRNKQSLTMMETFCLTSKVSDLILLTKEGSITQLINTVNFDGYDYVGVTNDDVAYCTDGWDVKLISSIKNNFGFAFGDDGTNNSTLPAICIMTANIPRTLGFIQLPAVTHLCGDLVWQYIGQKLNCLYYNKNVKILHNHFLHGFEKDEVYEKTNSKEMYNHDNKSFRQWIRTESEQQCLDLLQVQRRGNL